MNQPKAVVSVGLLILGLVVLLGGLAPHADAYPFGMKSLVELDPPPIGPPDPAPAVGPYIKLPATVTGDVASFISVSADTNGVSVVWKSIDRGLQLFPVDMLKDSRTAVVTAQSPGQYRLIAWTATGGMPSKAAECLVIVGGAPTPPGPTPPAPAPVSTHCYVLAIVDDSNPSAVVTQLVNSDTFKGVTSKGHSWRVYDINQPADPSNPTGKKLMDVRNYSSIIKEAGGAPCLLILDKGGNKLLATKFPTTPAALSAALAAVLGK